MPCRKSAGLGLLLTIAGCGPESQSDWECQGDWYVVWDRGAAGWSPKLFTGMLSIPSSTGDGTSAIWFEQTATSPWTGSINRTWAGGLAGVLSGKTHHAHLMGTCQDGQLYGYLDLVDEGGESAVGQTPVFGQRAWEQQANADPADGDIAPRWMLTSMLHEAQVSQSAGFVYTEDGRQVVSAGAGLTKKVNVASVSKAIGSLAVPFLLSEGRLDSLDQPLGPIVGWPVDDPRYQITMAHVLSHTTGLHTPEYPEWIKGVRHRHRTDVLGADLEVKPGIRFEYSNRSIELASVVVTKLSGVSLEEYLSERLFKPLQIDVNWFTGNDDHTRIHAGLRISAQDLAKLGNVLANDGSWNGAQIVPAGWLSHALESAGGDLPGEFRNSWRVNTASSSLRHTGDSGALLLIDLRHSVVAARTYDDQMWMVSDHKQLRSTLGIRRAVESRW